MPNRGKKIPSDIIKDQATRQAFDRVEQRIRELERFSRELIHAESDPIVNATVNGTITSATFALLSITTHGKPVDIYLSKVVERSTGWTPAKIHLEDNSLQGAVGSTVYEAQAILSIIRNRSTGDVVWSDYLGFKIPTDIVVTPYQDVPSGGIRCRDFPPAGDHIYTLSAIFQAGSLTIDGYRLCADTVK